MSRVISFSIYKTILRTYSSTVLTANSSKTFQNCVKIVNNRCFVPKFVRYSTDQKDVATYEEIKAISCDKCTNVLVIDVREPDELKETGVIPGSINIPLGEVECALRDLTNDEFLKKYGIKKPTSSHPIIFSCRSGKRSADAQTVSQQLGYKNVKNYLGGWLDWEEREQEMAAVDIKGPIVFFKEVRRLKDDPNYILIDVREPSELDNGSISNSINIPLDELETALTKLTFTEFQNKYGRDKPGLACNIIFSCRSGRRSAIAREKAISLGYNRVYDYSGSWLDWQEHTKA